MTIQLLIKRETTTAHTENTPADKTFNSIQNGKENQGQVKEVRFPLLTIVSLEANHRCEICNQSDIVKGKHRVCSSCGKGRLGPKYFNARHTVKKDNVVVTLEMTHDVIKSFLELSNTVTEDLDEIEDELLEARNNFEMMYNSGTNIV